MADPNEPYDCYLALSRSERDDYLQLTFSQIADPSPEGQQKIFDLEAVGAARIRKWQSAGGQ
jgi:hypothetical protein